MGNWLSQLRGKAITYDFICVAENSGNCHASRSWVDDRCAISLSALFPVNYPSKVLWEADS